MDEVKEILVSQFNSLVTTEGVVEEAIKDPEIRHRLAVLLAQAEFDEEDEKLGESADKSEQAIRDAKRFEQLKHLDPATIDAIDGRR